MTWMAERDQLVATLILAQVSRRAGGPYWDAKDSLLSRSPALDSALTRAVRQ
jgi:hypothetical protein